MQKCPECGSQKIANSLGEIVCKSCGLVIDDKVLMSGKTVC